MEAATAFHIREVAERYFQAPKEGVTLGVALPVSQAVWGMENLAETGVNKLVRFS